jgi:hypothetical protein
VIHLKSISYAITAISVSTFTTGALHSYHAIGLAAPLLLALCRFGQGIGLGCEWAALFCSPWKTLYLTSALYGMFRNSVRPFVLSYLKVGYD